MQQLVILHRHNPFTSLDGTHCGLASSTFTPTIFIHTYLLHTYSVAALHMKNELGITFKSHTSHEVNFIFLQTILCNASTNHHVDYPRLTSNLLLSKDSFYFLSLFLSPSIQSLIRTKLSVYSNSLNTSS